MFNPTINVIEKNIFCENCGHIEKLSKYYRLLAKTRDAVNFGYNYRIVYEKEYLTNQKLNRRFALVDIPKILEFLGLAVISGIVGNFSYAKIKVLCKRIASDSLLIQIKDAKLKNLLGNDKELKKFIRYLDEYRTKKFTTYDEVIKVIYGQEYIQDNNKELSKPKLKKKKKSQIIKSVSKKKK